MGLPKEMVHIIDQNLEELPLALETCIKNVESKFEFPELSEDKYRHKIWASLYSLIANEEIVSLHPDLLTLTRILSREKTNLKVLVTKEFVDLLVERACLKDGKHLNDALVKQTAIEALKCLCNVIFNCNEVAKICSENGLIEAIIARIRDYSDLNSMLQIKYFDMKILFLITALCKPTRDILKDDLHGLQILIQTLEELLADISKSIKDPKNDLKKIALSDLQVDFCSELLKVLFNITLCDDEEEYHTKLVTTLHHYLLLPVVNEEKKFELHSHIINLFNNVPDNCIRNLSTQVEPGKKISNRFVQNGKNMLALQELVNFLEDRFNSKQPNVSNQRDTLLPILSVLHKCATSDRDMRKYLKKQILPPLTDVHSRPEQGSTLRNHMCRLLTTPITEVRDFVAELLFILCKESVGRMIKYTGYGNAAGLFANRGLLGGRKRAEVSTYSSDSEDSDTDEYKEHKHGINPVMGCYEAPHPSPMANMTEEQKEYEAMKLVELMDTLTRHGIVKPCKIGADGRPQAIEHVLQLQEGLRDMQVRNNSDSDSE